jgi:DNA-binding NarL/FixJ family response regulator
MAQVVALVDDMIFQAKMAETARLVGVELKTVSTGDALVVEVMCSSPRLVVVDLNASQSAIEAIKRLRAAGSQTPLVAYVSHVQVELAARARAAGAGEVMPRSQFTQNLTTILSAAKS